MSEADEVDAVCTRPRDELIGLAAPEYLKLQLGVMITERPSIASTSCSTA